MTTQCPHSTPYSSTISDKQTKIQSHWDCPHVSDKLEVGYIHAITKSEAQERVPNISYCWRKMPLDICVVI